MKPSSAIALVSAMLGAGTPLAASAFLACEIESGCLPQAASSSVAAAKATLQRRDRESSTFMSRQLLRLHVKEAAAAPLAPQIGPAGLRAGRSYLRGDAQPQGSCPDHKLAALKRGRNWTKVHSRPGRSTGGALLRRTGTVRSGGRKTARGHDGAFGRVTNQRLRS